MGRWKRLPSLDVKPSRLKSRVLEKIWKRSWEFGLDIKSGRISGEPSGRLFLCMFGLQDQRESE